MSITLSSYIAICCTYGACHLAIIPVSGRHRSTHITYNIIYELYTFYIICITHTIWYFIMIYDVMIHAHCSTYGDRPPDGPLSLLSTERTFGRRCPFDFFGYFFSPLCVSLLRRGRYTDCDSPRLLLRNKLYTRYYTHIVVVGRNCGLTSFMWLITNDDQ